MKDKTKEIEIAEAMRSNLSNAVDYLHSQDCKMLESGERLATIALFADAIDPTRDTSWGREYRIAKESICKAINSLDRIIQAIKQERDTQGRFRKN